jgi:CRISPR-associated protein Cas1
MKDLHILPKVKDSWSYLYIEHSKIDQYLKSITVHDAKGAIQVPCAVLSLLMLGPGTSITHAAVKTLADNGCMLMWCGEEGIRVYAVGLGETRSSRNLLRQVRLHSDPDLRLQVVRRMYEYRFPGEDLSGLRLEQLRGREGVRVRESYSRASSETGVEWKGRDYKSGSWRSADPINRALSAGNSCLYGLCHAAIVASGYSPALGFIHTGKALSFVYDVADLYKATIVIPAAFRLAADGNGGIETRMRHLLRDKFFESRLLEKIVPDLAFLMSGTASPEEQEADFDADDALPSGLWDPETGIVAGGVNHSDPEN